MQALPAHASEAMRVANGDPVAIARVKDRWPTFLHALRDWRFWADKRQLPPEGDWHGWLMLAGRGFGKTRAGAEWIHTLAEEHGSIRIALIGATMDEARAIMVEGQSGILATRPRTARPKWEPSRGRLKWATGAEAFLYSGENPERLRGPEHHFAWCDELAKWAWPQGCWDMLQMGMRLGERPRTLVTTTPRPLALLRRLAADPGLTTVAGQAQKEATHNEALILADILVQPVVQSVGPVSVPSSPGLGQCWIVGAGATGAWAGHDGAIACWTDGGWRFFTAGEGMSAWSLSDGLVMRRTASAWLAGQEQVAALIIGGNQVVGSRQTAVANPAGGSVVDSEARVALTAILSALRTHGLIAP